MKDKKHNSREKVWFIRILTFVVIILVFAIGFVFGRMGFEAKWEGGEFTYSIKGQLYPEEKEINFELFWEVFDLLEETYVERSLNKEDLVNGAIKGMVDGVGDRATKFFTAEETEEYKEQRGGELEGVGIEMGYLNGEIVVKKVFPESPAKTSSLKVGDIIRKVDGSSIEELNIVEVSMKIRGEPGTQVVLGVYRPSEDEDKSIKIIRDAIHIESISWEMSDDNIAIITIRRFTEDTLILFYKAWDDIVKEVEAQNPEGLVVDLRNNGGGYLQGAVYIAEEFLEEESDILYIKNREGIVKGEKVNRLGGFRDIPLVVLVDGSTASSSEILAGALKHYDRATIVGKSTFGKGTAQDVIEPVSWGGASIHITTQKWLLPDKRWINEDNPIKPDVEVNITSQEMINGDDPQQDKALEVLK